MSEEFELAEPVVAEVDTASPDVQVVPSPTKMSADEYAAWRATGALPKADKASSGAEKSAEPAAASEAEKPQEKAQKRATAEDRKAELNREIRELLEKKNALSRELDTPRKQESQPAPVPPEVYVPLKEDSYFKDNPGAQYEDYLRAAARHEAKWEVRQEMQADRQRQQIEAAQKTLIGQVTEAQKRYPDFDQRIAPALQGIANDPQVPESVKLMFSESPVMPDLLYVFGDPAALQDLIATAKSNPGAALRKIVLTENLVLEELRGKVSGTDKDGGKEKEAARDSTGKFVPPAKKITSAPSPPSQVGGNGTTPVDEIGEAVKMGGVKGFQRFKELETARVVAQRRG